MSKMPKLNTRVFGYEGSVTRRFEGIYRGRRREGSGVSVKIYKHIELDDGSIHETALPIYPA